MSSTVKIELNSAGVAALLKGSEIQSDLARRAAAIASRAGTHAGRTALGVYGHDSSVGRTRARATVWTEDLAAMRAEAVDRVLTRAIDAGR